MGKSQSKAATNAKNTKAKGKTGDVPDSAYNSPDEDTATPTFDEPARVRTLSAPTKTRARASPSRRPPSRRGRSLTMSQDMYGERLVIDSRETIKEEEEEEEEEETTAIGAANLQIVETLEEVKPQDTVRRNEKARPQLKPKPTVGVGVKRAEQNQVPEIPEIIVAELSAITSPGDEANVGEPQLQDLTEVENTTIPGRESPEFFPDADGSPQNLRLSRSCDLLRGSPTASPSLNRRSYHKSPSEPLGSGTSTTVETRTWKSLSVESSPRFRKGSPVFGKTPQSLSEKNFPVPWSGHVRSQPPKTSSPEASATSTVSQGGGSSPAIKSAAGPVCSSTNGTPKLPRLALDNTSAAYTLVGSKGHRRTASAKVYVDLSSPTKAEKKQRRNSWDNDFRGRLNALLDSSAQKSRAPRTECPQQFFTPQPHRKERGSETITSGIL